MKPDKPTKIISYLSFALVFCLAVGAFRLSYSSLRATALAYGVQPELTWIWPLLVDFALIVFSLSVVRASLKGERPVWPWVLVGLYTVATLAFNVIHAPANLTARIVAVVAPVSLFLSFETLMAMLKAEVKRSSLIRSIAQIEAEMTKKRTELDKLQNDKREEIREMGRKATLELDSQLSQLDKMIEVNRLEKATLETQIDKASQRLNDITQQIEGKRQELNTTQDATLINVWDLVAHIDKAHLDTQTRQFFVALLTNAKVPQKDIAEWAGVTIKTVQRDIAGCNGLIKRERYNGNQK